MPRFRRLTGTVIGAVSLAVAGGAASPSVAMGQAASAGPPGPTSLATHARGADPWGGMHDSRPAVPARPAWRLDLGRHYGPAANASGYSAIVIAGRGVWAFGGTNPGGPSSPVAAFLAGGSWRMSRLPAGLTGFISAAAAPGPRDIWAMSGYGRYLVRWNGQHWRLAMRWPGPGTLSGLAAVGHRDIWVFGTSVDGLRTVGSWHFNGRGWARIRGAARDIYRASAVSRADVWAIEADPRGDVIARFNGRRWHRVAIPPAMHRIRWHDILAQSASRVWLAGDTGTGRLAFAHLADGHWTVIRTRVRAWAGELGGGHRRVVATATTSTLLASGLIIRLSGHRRVTWTAIATGFGSGVSDIAIAGWDQSLWASGGYLTRLGGNAAVWMRAGPPAQHRPRTSNDGS
jgi:hypothetical protein